MTEFNTEHANWKELSGMNIFNAAVEPGQSEFVLRNSGGWCWKAGAGALVFHQQASQACLLASDKMSPSLWREANPMSVCPFK